MEHEFVIMEINGELKTYTRYEDIPEKFLHVIKFIPNEEYPEPHTDEIHEEMAKWDDRLQELMTRERKYASSV